MGQKIWSVILYSYLKLSEVLNYAFYNDTYLNIVFPNNLCITDKKELNFSSSLSSTFFMISFLTSFYFSSVTWKELQQVIGFAQYILKS